VDDPIAVVHWTDTKGEDKNARCYDSAGLNALTTGLQQKSIAYITFYTSLSHPLPARRATRYFKGT
jgi:hypothetical protein